MANAERRPIRESVVRIARNIQAARSELAGRRRFAVRTVFEGSALVVSGIG
jgi:hypothetical protein